VQNAKTSRYIAGGGYLQFVLLPVGKRQGLNISRAVVSYRLDKTSSAVLTAGKNYQCFHYTPAPPGKFLSGQRLIVIPQTTEIFLPVAFFAPSRNLPFGLLIRTALSLFFKLYHQNFMFLYICIKYLSVLY
jgi:hypothetical protein